MQICCHAILLRHEQICAVDLWQSYQAQVHSPEVPQMCLSLCAAVFSALAIRL